MRRSKLSRKSYVFILIAVFLTTSCISGVSVKNIKHYEILDIRAQKSEHNRINMEIKPDKEKAEKEVLSFVKKYIEISYFDLNIVKKKDYFLSFFADDDKQSADKEFNNISLGETAKKILSIKEPKKAKVIVTMLSFVWSSKNTQQLISVDYEIKNLKYSAGLSTIKGEVKGKLVMVPTGGLYKIIDYSIEQSINTKRSKNQ